MLIFLGLSFANIGGAAKGTYCKFILNAYGVESLGMDELTDSS